MANFKKMYYSLFNDVTDAIELLKDSNKVNDAVEILKNAQIKCEDIYIDTADDEDKTRAFFS